MANYLINCKDVSVSYGEKKILDNISFAVEPSQIVTIIGPNGSGKTTLLKICCGLIAPSQGTITRNKDLTIGYMPQKITIDKVLPLTVRRFLRLNGKGSNMRSLGNVEQIAEEFGISHLLSSQIHDISGGEMQRVMLARAILLEPNLLILDEPTQGLDINGQAEFYKIIGQVRKTVGCGILLVSHDLNMVMASTDRVLCLNRHICCEGTPEDINNHPEYIAMFGKKAAENIAIYTHEHDHTHCLDGHVDEDGHA